MLKALANDELRNTLIINIALEEAQQGHTMLILSDRGGTFAKHSPMHSMPGEWKLRCWWEKSQLNSASTSCNDSGKAIWRLWLPPPWRTRGLMFQFWIASFWPGPARPPIVLSSVWEGSCVPMMIRRMQSSTTSPIPLTRPLARRFHHRRKVYKELGLEVRHG